MFFEVVLQVGKDSRRREQPLKMYSNDLPPLAATLMDISHIERPITCLG